MKPPLGFTSAALGIASAALGITSAALGIALAVLCAAAPAWAAGAANVAAHTWCTVRTPHLEVVTDAGCAVGARVASRLEQLHEALASLLPPLVVDAPPVQVIVFRDDALARSYAPTWRGLHDDVAGFSHSGPDRRRVVFVDDEGRTPSVAQHEYLHSLLDAAWPEVPLWLNEGLAEYVSTFSVDDGHARIGAAVKPHLEWLSAHDLMPLRQLFAIGATSSDYHEGDRRGTFYAQSWLLVHLLLSGSEGDLERLQRVLVACRDGARFETVFAREFGSEQSLRDKLAATLESGRLTVREWVLPAPVGATTPKVRDRSPAADVLGSLGLELLSRPVAQREEAEAHFQKALALDARAPDALAGMGWLELMRGRRTESRGWFDRTLAVTPVSATGVRVVASELLIDVAQRLAQGERTAAATYVRGALERALAADPSDAELLSLFARSWVVATGDDPEPGYVAAARAAQALPGRRDVQIDLLALAAHTGRDAEAQRICAERFGDGATPESRHAARMALLAGAVFQANKSVHGGDVGAAETRLETARDHVADDADVARLAQDYLDSLHASSRRVAATQQENAAIAEYNRAVIAANAGRFAEAEAAFRRAASQSARPAFKDKARGLAARVHRQGEGERAFALARAGKVTDAIAILEAMDRASMSAEERKWLDENLARLRARRR